MTFSDWGVLMRLTYANSYLPQAASRKEKAQCAKISEIYMHSAQMRKEAETAQHAVSCCKIWLCKAKQNWPFTIANCEDTAPLNVKAQEISGGEV